MRNGFFEGEPGEPIVAGMIAINKEVITEQEPAGEPRADNEDSQRREIAAVTVEKFGKSIVFGHVRGD